MDGWTEYVAAFAVFMLSHAVPARPAVRGRLVALLGERVYLIVYMALSLILLGWLIVAASRAPYVELWSYAPWQAWAPAVVMPAVCFLAAFGTGAVNPLSFGGRRPDAFDPDEPGIAGLTRHPILWALALWAAAHIVPNGDLAHGGSVWCLHPLLLDRHGGDRPSPTPPVWRGGMEETGGPYVSGAFRGFGNGSMAADSCAP